MNQEVCGLVKSVRGQPKIIVRGYLLVKDKNRNDKYYWYCEFKNALRCKGRAVIILEGEEHVLKKFNDHNHAPEASHADVVQTLNTIKDAAFHTHDQPVQIIQNAVTNMPQDSYYYMPSKEALRK